MKLFAWYAEGLVPKTQEIYGLNVNLEYTQQYGSLNKNWRGVLLSWISFCLNNHTWTRTHDKHCGTCTDSTNKKEEAPQLCCSLLQWRPATILHIKISSPIATHRQLPKDHLPLSKSIRHNKHTTCYSPLLFKVFLK